ncbi:hypothetical protein KY285_023615 [Solanum tuberosum]|nr:hypothetical protein KY289_023946 [Solanum tuberosum]KAH0675814.1 hypothetical protein KY285_023615 [Solanum tuberosum]
MGVVLRVLEPLNFQGWADLFLDTRVPLYEKEVREFYTNLNVLEGSVVTSTVNGVELGRVTPRDRKVLKGKMSPFHKLVFELVHKGILLRGERRHEASFRDIGISHALENKDPIDWPSLMIKQMARVIDPKPGAH